jgi:hypothetical protein
MAKELSPYMCVLYYNILKRGSLDNGYLDNGSSNKYEKNLKNRKKNL